MCANLVHRPPAAVCPAILLWQHDTGTRSSTPTANNLTAACRLFLTGLSVYAARFEKSTANESSVSPGHCSNDDFTSFACSFCPLLPHCHLAASGLQQQMSETAR